MKRFLSFVLIALLCLSTVFAGGSAEAETTESGKTPITMWFWGASVTNQEALQRSLVDPFNAAHPDYELIIEYRPSVNTDMAVALAANEGPDIIYESSPSLSKIYIQSGKYADLTPYSEKYGWKDRIIGPMYDSNCVDGKLYSIPMGLSYIVMVYNEDVLEENGWAVPTTIEELTDIMDQALAKGMYASVNGEKGWKPTNEDYLSLFFTNFAGPEEIYKCLTGQQKWNSEWVHWAIDQSKEWFDKGYLCSDYVNIDWAEAAQLLIDGRAPFFFGPIRFIQNFSQYVPDDENDFIKMTVFPGAREGVEPSYTIGAGGILAINANSEHKDICAEFIDMFLSTDFVEEVSQGWPGYWGVPLKNLDEINTENSTGLTKSFLESLKVASAEIDAGNFGYYASSYLPAETFDLCCNVDSVWLGAMTTDEFLDSLDTAFEREFAEGLVPSVPLPGSSI